MKEQTITHKTKVFIAGSTFRRGDAFEIGANNLAIQCGIMAHECVGIVDPFYCTDWEVIIEGNKFTGYLLPDDYAPGIKFEDKLGDDRP